MKCLEIYASLLRKSAGERGGHVIGTTRSGKPIYASHHSSNRSVIEASEEDNGHVRPSAAMHAHPKFNSHDHLDAAEAHASEASRATNREHRANSHTMSQAHALASMGYRARDKEKSPS